MECRRRVARQRGRTGHLYASDGYGGNIYEIDPIAQTNKIILSGFHNPDGLALSPDGKTLYVALDADDNIIGLDTHTHQIVFNYNQLNPFNHIDDPDGIALGAGILKGYACVFR